MELDFDYLYRCLKSLSEQDLSPECANEVLLVESGGVPYDLLDEIRVTYPWISIYRTKAESGYYEAKMDGVTQTTGEIVVFCDSDCIYESGWLRNILNPFSQNKDIQVVAGETSVAVTGPYSLSILLCWFALPFTYRKKIYESSGYAANNVAFRRGLLISYPIPCKLPLYRGNDIIHKEVLLREGVKIWQQPQARIIHPIILPSQFFWRFFMFAHHDVSAYRLASGSSLKGGLRVSLVSYLIALLRIPVKRFIKTLLKIPFAIRQNPLNLAFLPLAIPIVLISLITYMCGFISSCFSPDFMRRVSEKFKSIAEE